MTDGRKSTDRDAWDEMPTTVYVNGEGFTTWTRVPVAGLGERQVRARGEAVRMRDDVERFAAAVLREPGLRGPLPRVDLWSSVLSPAMRAVRAAMVDRGDVKAGRFPEGASVPECGLGTFALAASSALYAAVLRDVDVRVGGELFPVDVDGVSSLGVPEGWRVVAGFGVTDPDENVERTWVAVLPGEGAVDAWSVVWRQVLVVSDAEGWCGPSGFGALVVAALSRFWDLASDRQRLAAVAG